MPFLGLTIFATRRLSQSIDAWQSPGTKRAMESSLALARKSLSKYEADLRALGPRLGAERSLLALVAAGSWDETTPLLTSQVEQLSVDFLQLYEKDEQNWVFRQEVARRGVSSPGAFPQELLRRALESNDVLRSEAGYVALPVLVQHAASKRLRTASAAAGPGGQTAGVGTGRDAGMANAKTAGTRPGETESEEADAETRRPEAAGRPAGDARSGGTTGTVESGSREPLPAKSAGESGQTDPALYVGIAGDKLIVPGYWLGEDFFPNVKEVTEGRLYYGQLEIYKRVAKQSVWVTAAALFALGTAVSLVAAALLARQLSKPILALTNGMKRVAAGNLNEKVAAKASGEIKYLVDSFNRMIEELKFHKEQLARAERIAAWQDVARYAAHEIRNPLTPIKVSIHRLRSRLDRLDDAERHRFSDGLESIFNEVSSLERLATSFSEFARLPDPVLAPTDVNSIIRELAELYENADVRIALDLSETLPVIEADAQQMRMAFINVMKNAIEAQPDGGELRVSTATVPRLAAGRSAAGRPEREGARPRPGTGPKSGGASAPWPEPGRQPRGKAEVPWVPGVVLTRSGSDISRGDFIEIAFSDKGCGIPETLMNRVGAPHFTTKKGGTGLGLAVVNKIVSQHDGSLTIESREAQGTTVRIMLPTERTANG